MQILSLRSTARLFEVLMHSLTFFSFSFFSNIFLDSILIDSSLCDLCIVYSDTKL
jgi:hypothetical protein